MPGQPWSGENSTVVASPLATWQEKHTVGHFVAILMSDITIWVIDRPYCKWAEPPWLALAAREVTHFCSLMMVVCSQRSVSFAIFIRFSNILENL